MRILARHKFARQRAARASSLNEVTRLLTGNHLTHSAYGNGLMERFVQGSRLQPCVFPTCFLLRRLPLLLLS